jgi:putative SOS response-associated peptidase YedK
LTPDSFHRFASIQEIATQFNAKPRGELLAPPNYNAAPQDWHLVIRLDEEGEREIVSMRWGLVPYWILLANSGGATEVSEMRLYRHFKRRSE